MDSTDNKKGVFRGLSILNEENYRDIVKPISKSSKLSYMLFCLVLIAFLTTYGLLRGKHADGSFNYTVMAILGVADLLIIVMGIVKCVTMDKRAVRLFKEQIQTKYQTDCYKKEILFEEEQMVTISGETEKKLRYTDVAALYETSRNIIFKMRGRLYFWVDKETMEGGSLTDFKNYISEKTGKRI